MKIGITGGIAEGKSTVLSHLSALGHATANADQIARGVFEDARIQAQLADRLGLSLPLDRAAVRDRMARSHEARRSLNRILHPEVRRRIRDSGATFFEVPLLIEAVMMADFEEVWVVTCGPEEQRMRLTERVGSAVEAQRLIATQLPSRAKIPFADRIIRTNLPLETVFLTVENQVREVLRLK